jgi:hypothetical protein
MEPFQRAICQPTAKTLIYIPFDVALPLEETHLQETIRTYTKIFIQKYSLWHSSKQKVGNI